jgi:F420-non-reducing hydrogenase large subunit
VSIKRAAQKLIQPGKGVGQGILNMVEMAFRLNDPCLSCATHSLRGEMPLIIDVFNAKGEIVHHECRVDKRLI